MHKRTWVWALGVGITSLLVCVSIVYADTRDITATLGGAVGDIFNVQGAMKFDSITVGRQGVGGVTYFNGTIANATTGDGGADNPVTFGDNVRIDGRVYRGTEAGADDSQPFIVNDNMEVVGSLTIGSLSGDGIIGTAHLADSAVTSGKIADGAIGAADLASDSVTSTEIASGAVTSSELASNAVTSSKISSNTVTGSDIATGAVGTDEIADNAVTNSEESNLSSYESISDADIHTLQTLTMTTGASPLFCTWSGYGDTSNAGEGIWIYVQLDGSYIDEAYRIMKTPAGTRHVTLATNILRSVSAGTHTVEIDWSTTTAANMYQATLDCIELKK